MKRRIDWEGVGVIFQCLLLLGSAGFIIWVAVYAFSSRNLEDVSFERLMRTTGGVKVEVDDDKFEVTDEVFKILAGDDYEALSQDERLWTFELSEESRLRRWTAEVRWGVMNRVLERVKIGVPVYMEKSDEDSPER